jgi:DNA-directed RNA polymerase specialized sigma24 family protein
MSHIDAERLLAHLQILCRRYRSQLGPDLAADLAAEALERGLRHPPPDGRMEPWLERILRNLVVDHWRRAARPIEAPIHESPATPEELALARERRHVLARSLGALSPELRRSLLRRYGGDGHGGGVSTGRTRVHRGLRRLRELMKGLHAFLPPLGQGAVAAQIAVVVLVAQQTPPSVSHAPPTPHVPSPVVHAAPARPKAAPAPKASEAAPRPAPKHYDFDDDEIVGDLQQPDGIVVTPSRASRHSSLIEIPDSFRAAVIKSVEDL